MSLRPYEVASGAGFGSRAVVWRPCFKQTKLQDPTPQRIQAASVTSVRASLVTTTKYTPLRPTPVFPNLFFRPSINFRRLKVDYKNNANSSFRKIRLFIANIHKW